MQGIDLTVSRIEEFTALNKSILELTERTRNSFINQKQFIENASHEMQTPLAITLSKLELLIEDPHLTEPQSEIIQALINSTQRMAKLNKTLLLLSKIENQQFMEKEEVRLKPLFEEILTYFEEQKENLQLSVTMEIQQDAAVIANPVLVDLLFTNLIKNAFSHNILHGSVHLVVNHKTCTISNTSSGDAIPEGKLFQRFYKQSIYKDSWGLGLALVKKICTINQWNISYKAKDGIHSFIVQYKV
jgi:signal transduction histidine kinase